MNYYVFTFSGEGLPIAKKLQDEGQNVTVAMIEDNKDILTKDEKHNPEEKHEKERRMALYDGIVPKVSAKEAVSKIKAMSPEKQKETFLFFDFNHCFKYSEELMGTECQGNFPTSKDREMEVSRDEAKAFVEKNYPSLKVAENQEFKSAKDGIKFLSESQDAWVLKGMDEDAKTVVPDTNDPEQANPQVMQALETSGKSYEKSGYILEKMIPNLIEVTPEIHFYNGKPLATTMDIELKRFGGGNTSVMTGCSADLVFETEMESEINKMAFPPVVYEMAKKHKGWFVWDASILFDKDTGEAFFGEYCPNRVGYNCFYSEMTLVGSAKDFFERLVSEKNPFSKKQADFAGSVRVFNIHKDSERMVAPDEAIEVDDFSDPYTFVMDMKKDEDDKMSTTGYSWDVAVVTGCGDSVKDAFVDAYANLEGLSFLEKYTRPLHDVLSSKYENSIKDRYKYIQENGLI